MPTVNDRQRGFFHVCDENPSKARGKCPPKAVVEEFLAADHKKARGRKSGQRAVIDDMLKRRS